jgi:hypothetical protein
MGENMKTIKIIISVLIFAANAIAETNAPPSDLTVVQIKTIPFMLRYDGKEKITMQFAKSGFVVTEVTTNEITLSRGEEILKVTKGFPVSYSEYEITVLDKKDGKHYVIQSGRDERIGSQTFVIRHVNLEKESCTLMDVHSRQIRTIRTEKAQQPSAP